MLICTALCSDRKGALGSAIQGPFNGPIFLILFTPKFEQFMCSKECMRVNMQLHCHSLILHSQNICDSDNQCQHESGNAEQKNEAFLVTMWCGTDSLQFIRVAECMTMRRDKIKKFSRKDKLELTQSGSKWNRQGCFCWWWQWKALWH